MWKVYVNGTIFSTSDSSEIAIGNPTLTYELNKSASFTFMVPANHPRRGDLQARQSTVQVVDADTSPDSVIFRGIVRSIEETFYGSFEVTCSDKLIFLDDSVQRPAIYQDVGGYGFESMMDTLITNHNSQVNSAKRFLNTFPAIDEMEFEVKANYETTLQLMTSIANKYETKFWYDSVHDTLILGSELSPTLPPASAPTLILGANILDLAIETEALDICTRLIPLGKKTGTQTVPGIDDRLTIESVNGGLDYIDSPLKSQYGVVTRTVVFDEVTTATRLLRYGNKYLNTAQYESVTYDIKVADLYKATYDFWAHAPFPQRFDIGAYYELLFPPKSLNIRMLLTKKTQSLDDPTKNVLTFGFKSIEPITAQTAKLNNSAAQARVN